MNDFWSVDSCHSRTEPRSSSSSSLINRSFLSQQQLSRTPMSDPYKRRWRRSPAAQHAEREARAGEGVCVRLGNDERRAGPIPAEQIRASAYHNIYLHTHTHTCARTHTHNNLSIQSKEYKDSLFFVLTLFFLKCSIFNLSEVWVCVHNCMCAF